ncbi:AAA family ATPase [Irregularibacter muris]|uniref:AAA family ATPase n=1 Tax=Irregularibacter muris TaxID=1796619 RepID=A0AAE3KYF3_9FIRM|nr:AAA family ATPase [Irregularibacter muris]MCR1897375.1 AAA family ATPase [Irregularibacter muris]
MDEKFIKGIKIDWARVEKSNYSRNIPSIQSINQLYFNSNITFFVGENGTGKSTLLESIAVAYGFNPEGGNRNFNFSTMDTHSELHQAITVIKGVSRPKSNFFLRAESFYNVASKIEDYRDGDDYSAYYESYGGKSMHEQSHGESFLALIQNRFTTKGLYILDEPEAALSPQRQLTLLILIYNLAQKGTQFIIASHSPILLGMPGASILSFGDGKIREITYEETESYKVTELFINNRQLLLNNMLENE